MDPFTLKEIADAVTESKTDEVPKFDVSYLDDSGHIADSDFEDLSGDIPIFENPPIEDGQKPEWIDVPRHDEATNFNVSSWDNSGHIVDSDLRNLNNDISKIPETNENENSDVVKDNDSEVTNDLPQESTEQVQSETSDTNVDDNGKEYKDKDGNLLPNIEYELNGIKYQTDDKGRVTSWDGNLKDTPEPRDKDAQKDAGGKDRQENDHGGHLVASMNGGSGDDGNMVAMRGHLNQSDYKRGENEENQMLKDGKNVHESGTVYYDGDSSRPSKIEKEYTDGEKTVKATYDNEVGSTDLLNNLDGTISQEDLDSLKDELSDMQADGNVVSVTSVTNEYDSEGNLTKTTVGIRNETTGEKEFKTYNH